MKNFDEYVLEQRLDESTLAALKDIAFDNVESLKKAAKIVANLPAALASALKRFVVRKMAMTANMKQLKKRIDALKTGDWQGLKQIISSAPKEEAKLEDLTGLFSGFGGLALLVAVLYALSKWGEDIGKPWYDQK